MAAVTCHPLSALAAEVSLPSTLPCEALNRIEPKKETCRKSTSLFIDLDFKNTYEDVNPDIRSCGHQSSRFVAAQALSYRGIDALNE